MDVSIAIATFKILLTSKKKVVTNIEEPWDSDQITFVLIIEWNS